MKIMQLHYVIRKQVSRVELQKDGTTSIGIVLKDGVKTGSRPVIKAIKKGSIAYRSHCVSERDAIVSVCGLDARGMSRRDFKHLLREAESKIDLEVEYQFREACLNKSGVYRMERIVLNLKKELESFGFVLRKPGLESPASLGYPIISCIKEGGPADRDGRLKAGDRILRIDQHNLEALSISQITDILQAKDEATFIIEYKIALIENSQIRLGERTNLEIDCPDGDLGLVLGSSGSRMLIEEIRKGSLADRCGAFRVGDDILEINDIDVMLLSTSKANNLLRNLKKEAGRLVLVANTSRVARLTENSYLPRGKIKPFAQLTPERDQQVPSNDRLLVSGQSPQSLFSRDFEDNTRSFPKCDCFNFQMKTIVMLRDVIENIANLEKFIPSLSRNNVTASMDNLGESNRDQINDCQKLSRLANLSSRVQNSAYYMAMNLLKNERMLENLRPENFVRSNGCYKNYSKHLNQDNVIPELMRNLVKIYTKKLISMQNFEKLQLKINSININCWKCYESSMLATLTTQKILLISSFNSKTKDICFLINKFIDDIFRILPCEDCRAGFGSQIGSEISRAAHLFNPSNRLNTKPRLTRVIKGKVALSSTDPTESVLPGTSVSTLDHLHNKASSSVSSLLSSQSQCKFPTPVNSSSADLTISKDSTGEDVSYLKGKTKTDNPTQTRSHEKPFQRQLKPADNDYLCFTSSSHQSQILSEDQALHNTFLYDAGPSYQSQIRSEDQAQHDSPIYAAGPSHQSQNLSGLHNSSLGFATPNTTYHKTLVNRGSITKHSTPQSSSNVTNRQNDSFSSQTDLLPCRDNTDYEQRNNGKNYSSNICKKIFREKGLQKMQRKTCKSAEVIADTENDLLKHSNTNIQKHASEPQFLSTRCQSLTERVPNYAEKEDNFYTKVETLDSKREMDDANQYWSPFHRSGVDDHPNILDIPNWSAKSSHSLKRIGQASNERTTQDTVDVTLKNEGKGYGLTIEFPSSPTEDGTNQLPLITAVSSQGAAHKIGILLKGDRVLSINGQNTSGMTATELEWLKEQAFGGDEVLLTVEFDVVLREMQSGTFDVSVTKTSKTGLIYNDFKKGSPLVVKGIVKGSSAHRCGSLVPGDEVLYANNIRQEFYDVSKNTYKRSEFVIIRVRRQTSDGDETNLDQAQPLSPFKTYDLSRTSIHSDHGSNEMLLEQELVLYRDPVAKDFGFLIGQDQISKTIYVTGIRPGGPADSSKVIKKHDIILRVNGVDLEANKEGPVASLFHPAGDRLELKTCRILKYE